MKSISTHNRGVFRWFAMVLTAVLLCVSCSRSGNKDSVDRLNDLSYHFHYTSLDSARYYALQAMNLAEGYDDGLEEAANNLAFVDIMHMDYDHAKSMLDSLVSKSDNHIELLVANVQLMRLCQRQSKNKEFYEYYWKAHQSIERILEEENELTDRQKQRFLYARTEFCIVLSAYLYYLGQEDASREALKEIDDTKMLVQDTMQLVNYYYNIGSGGYVVSDNQDDVVLKEFEYLVQCYTMSEAKGMLYWQANALQSLSEHILNKHNRDLILSSNRHVMDYLNRENMPDSLLAGNFALRAVEKFQTYGDVYQTAGALRTLADCHVEIGEQQEAIACLNDALSLDTMINRSPDMVSSIREKLSIVYASIDDKVNSDVNRNIYLDLQDATRQDKEMEARADQLQQTSFQLNVMIFAVCAAIILLLVSLYVFTKMRRNNEKNHSLDYLLTPLGEWEQQQIVESEKFEERQEELEERTQMAELIAMRGLEQHIEYRAKQSLVNSVKPFIDRMLAEIQFLSNRDEDDETKEYRYQYIRELTDKIQEYNDILTRWIQVRKGELSLRIESFAVQELFDMLKKGSVNYTMNGVRLNVQDTTAVVKADKTLTMFMINTLADNARRYTGEQGEVSVYTDETADYVEISVKDNGCGMSEEQVASLFTPQVHKIDGASTTGHYGFGLMNCKGIINKYRKVSSIFNVCELKAESREGEGSVFSFRLPKGVGKTLAALCMLLTIPFSAFADETAENTNEAKAAMYAEGVYNNNIDSLYENALACADSALYYINKVYIERTGKNPPADSLLSLRGKSANQAPEIRWFSDSVDVRYDLIMDIRNEVAVAALALHDWDTYHYNNRIFTRLYSLTSADSTLSSFVQQTQNASENKSIALILLIILLVAILPAYYLLYYRHRVYHRFLIDRLNAINSVLVEEGTDEQRLETIRNIWNSNHTYITDDKEVTKLNDIVEKICSALEANIHNNNKNLLEEEIAEDELRRINYEIDRLHISNNVLENCMSTLKHETMYYPSRIRQLVDKGPDDLKDLLELTTYYDELYTLFSLQAQRQTESVLKIDGRIRDYLISLLKKVADDRDITFVTEPAEGGYTRYVIAMKNLQLTDDQVVNFYTPLTINTQCLIIRQIVREIGEATNQRGCGVYARRNDSGIVETVLTLSKIKLD